MKAFTKYLLSLVLFTTTAVKPLSLPDIKSVSFKGHIVPAVTVVWACLDEAAAIYKDKACQDQDRFLPPGEKSILKRRSFKGTVVNLGILFVAYCLYTK